MKSQISRLFISIMAIFLPYSQIKPITTQESVYALASTTGIAVIMGLFANYKRQCANREADRLKKQVADLKNETRSLAEDETFLSEVNTYIQYLENINNQELSLWVKNNESCNESFVNELFNYLRIKLQFSSDSNNFSKKDEYIKRFAEDFKTIVSFNEKLKVKLLQWLWKENRSHLIDYAKNLQNKLEKLKTFLHDFSLMLDMQTNILHLTLLLELLTTKINDTNGERNLLLLKHTDSNYNLEVDKFIRTKFANVQFPYLSYSYELTIVCKLLEDLIKLSKKLKLFEFQEHIVSRSGTTYNGLKEILEFIVKTDAFKDEKEKKPVFDREEERLKMELKEKQARIDNEKKLVEAKLLAEKNKTHELSNKQLEMEKALKDLAVREKQINYEWARIRDAENIKLALEQNDRKWRYDCDQLQRKYDTIFQNYNYLKVDFDKETSRLNAQIKELESKLKYSNNDKLANEVKTLKNKMRDAQNRLDNLKRLCSTPPYNPDTVSWLRAYLNQLSGEAAAIKSLLS